MAMLCKMFAKPLAKTLLKLLPPEIQGHIIYIIWTTFSPQKKHILLGTNIIVSRLPATQA